MSQRDREKWDREYASRRESGTPTPFLPRVADLLPQRGRVLDVAGGAGRHALWLAQRGLDVTLVDISPRGLAVAEREAAAASLTIRTMVLDLDTDPLPPGPWDVIVCICFLARTLFPAFAERLAPGGTLVFCQPTRTNLERNARPPEAFLLEDGELPRLLDGLPLEILHYREGWTPEIDRHDAELVARRRPD